MASVRRDRKGLTEAAYAERIGMSRSGVRNAKAAGRIALYDDGSINASASDALLASMTDPSKQRGAMVRISDDEGGDTLELPASADFLEVKTFHERRKVEKLQIEIAKRRGELVERAAAEAMVFDLARRERDAWMAWPARVSAQMAAELGVDARTLEGVMDRHLREHLAGLSEMEVDLT